MIISIDGSNFDLNIVELKEEDSFLDKSAERTEDGDLHRELIGLFCNYTVKLGEFQNKTQAYNFYNKISEVVEYHTVTMPRNDTTITFQCYITGISRSLRKYGGTDNMWGGYTVKFIAKKPQFTP